MTNNITRDDISDFINQEFGLTKKDCNDLVNDIIEEIVLGLNSPNSVPRILIIPNIIESAPKNIALNIYSIAKHE